jgi:hypothetical protein
MVHLKHDLKLPLRRRARWAALASLALISILLAGCLPAAQPTMPPATQVSSSPAPAVKPTSIPLPPALPTLPPTVAAAAPTAASQPASAANRQAVTVTILHTNDVRGETDPCG